MARNLKTSKSSLAPRLLQYACLAASFLLAACQPNSQHSIARLASQFATPAPAPSPVMNVPPAIDPAEPKIPVTPAPVSAQPNWQRFLVCEQGKTWVDVDLNERRNIQVVSHNLAANQFFSMSGLIAPSQSADLSQVVFQMHQDSGIFKITDFYVANNQGSLKFVSPVKVGNDYMTEYSVVSRAFRDSSGTGLNLEFVMTNMLICSFYDSVNQTCSGGITYPVRDRYVGVWFFPGCQPVAF